MVRYYLQLRKKKSDAHGEIVVEPVEKIIGRGSIRPRRVDQKKEAKKESSKSELEKNQFGKEVSRKVSRSGEEGHCVEVGQSSTKGEMGRSATAGSEQDSGHAQQLEKQAGARQERAGYRRIRSTPFAGGAGQVNHGHGFWNF